MLAGMRFKGSANKKVIERLRDKDVKTLGKLTDYTVLDQLGISAEEDSAPLPEPVTDWHLLNKQLQIALAEADYAKPTPIQSISIPCFKNHKEIIALSPTGSGKTLAYALSLLDVLKDEPIDELKALVLVHTRELAQQIHRQFCRFAGETTKRVQLLLKNHGMPKCQILIATPKRLLQFKKEKLFRIKYVVLDEADCLLSHSFEKQTDQVLAAIKYGPAADGEITIETPTNKFYSALFSATMNKNILAKATSFMDMPVICRIGGRNAVAANIKQELQFVGNEKGKVVELKQRIIEGKIELPAIIFVMNKQRAHDLAGELGYPSSVLTSELNDSERAEAVRKLRTGAVQFLITTDLGGRGIDLPSLMTVINFDMPPDSTTYVHRIGRTARAGRSGSALTFFTEDDQPNMYPVASVMHQQGYEVPEYMLKGVDKRHRGQRALYEPVQRKSISSKVWKNAKVRVPKGDLPPSVEDD